MPSRRPSRAASAAGRAGDYGQLGIRGVAELDTRNEKAYPTRGVKLSFDAAAYPAIWDNEGTFGGGEIKAATYLSAPLPLTPVLALRAGARRMWGALSVVRGRVPGRAINPPRLRARPVRRRRLGVGRRGLRLKLARLAVVLPMDVGVYGLADVGRVWLDGEDFDRWHTAYGAGIWLHALRPSLRGTVTLAWGDNRTVLYIGSGFHF